MTRPGSPFCPILLEAIIGLVTEYDILADIPVAVALIASVLIGGLYYRAREKDDPESVKIYSIASVVGAVVAIVSGLLLIFR